MAEYAINKDGTDMWATEVGTSNPGLASPFILTEWETIWNTEDEEEATSNCPSGFSVGPRPPRPH